MLCHRWGGWRGAGVHPALQVECAHGCSRLLLLLVAESMSHPVTSTCGVLRGVKHELGSCYVQTGACLCSPPMLCATNMPLAMSESMVLTQGLLRLIPGDPCRDPAATDAGDPVDTLRHTSSCTPRARASWSISAATLAGVQPRTSWPSTSSRTSPTATVLEVAPPLDACCRAVWE